MRLIHGSASEMNGIGSVIVENDKCIQLSLPMHCSLHSLSAPHSIAMEFVHEFGVEQMRVASVVVLALICRFEQASVVSHMM